MVSLSVEHGDALATQSDVLILKHAQEPHGLDRTVSEFLDSHEIWPEKGMPGEGEFRLVHTPDSKIPSIASDYVLFVGVSKIPYFGYEQIRTFAERAILAATKKGADISPQSICMTLHGAEYGLDESEAFRSEVKGIIDALDRHYPDHLEKIRFVEKDRQRAETLENTLSEFLPGEYIPKDFDKYLEQSGEEVEIQIESVGKASEDKPHVFVAMPFRNEFDKTYDLGIKKAVQETGFLCERVDRVEYFPGDIVDEIKNRIESSEYVIADLTNGNPNVYLEVGYSWGHDVPTILVTNNMSDLEFDVQNQNCIEYEDYYELKSQLTEALTALSDD